MATDQVIHPDSENKIAKLIILGHGDIQITIFATKLTKSGY